MPQSRTATTSKARVGQGAPLGGGGRHRRPESYELGGGENQGQGVLPAVVVTRFVRCKVGVLRTTVGYRVRPAPRSTTGCPGLNGLLGDGEQSACSVSWGGGGSGGGFIVAV